MNWAAGIDGISEAKGAIAPFKAGLGALGRLKHFNIATVITADDAPFAAKGLFIYLENKQTVKETIVTRKM